MLISILFQKSQHTKSWSRHNPTRDFPPRHPPKAPTELGPISRSYPNQPQPQNDIQMGRTHSRSRNGNDPKITSALASKTHSNTIPMSLAQVYDDDDDDDDDYYYYYYYYYAC